MEMVKNVRTCALVALLAIGVEAFAQNAVELGFKWDRTAMDGSRTASGVNTDKGTCRKVKKIVDAAQPHLAELKTVVGYSDAELVKHAPESPLSNWFADLLIVEGEKISGRKIDVSVGNFGGIRVDMPKGNVTVDDIRSMFPFKNEVVILQMRGSSLRELFSQLAKNSWQVLGGVRIEAANRELVSVTVGGEPLDDDRLYTVVSNDFLLDGGDNLYLGSMCEGDVERTGHFLYETVMAHIDGLRAEGRHIHGEYDGRIHVTTPHPLGKKPSSVYEGLAPEYTVGAKTAPHRLSILHTNDTHSHIDPIRAGDGAGTAGVLERSVYLDSVRRADGPCNVLLVDAGDFEQGTPYFSLLDGVVEIGTMNKMGYDAVTMGNHEFDNGLDDLAKRMKMAMFKIVLCNYEFNHKELNRIIKPYAIFRRGGHKIGVVGVLTDVTTVVDKGVANQMKYLDPAEKVNEWAAFLKNKKGCDLVIVLSHLGTAPGHSSAKVGVTDISLAKQTRNVDIIIGGHTHTDLSAPLMLPNPDGRLVPVVTDYRWGQYVGEIKIN